MKAFDSYKLHCVVYTEIDMRMNEGEKKKTISSAESGFRRFRVVDLPFLIMFMGDSYKGLNFPSFLSLYTDVVWFECNPLDVDGEK